MTSPYFHLEILVKITDEERSFWDCQGDRTFSLGNIVNRISGIDVEEVHLIDYSTITEQEFSAKKYNIFNEEGGI